MYEWPEKHMTPEDEHRLVADVAVLKEKMDQIPDMRKEIKDIHDVMVKYKGFAGGIVFIVSAIWGSALLAWSFITAENFDP